ncbi:hypothetical protein J6590_096014 [Homalodisca vitripennis]|nr:hypothetical protein J6590_041959 [Homalodisca vitripennis]KAG8274986.1 hypothetical protein J6590_096014 [Homalodisca vitripennis]
MVPAGPRQVELAGVPVWSRSNALPSPPTHNTVLYSGVLIVFTAGAKPACTTIVMSVENTIRGYLDLCIPCELFYTSKIAGSS